MEKSQKKRLLVVAICVAVIAVGVGIFAAVRSSNNKPTDTTDVVQETTIEQQSTTDISRDDKKDNDKKQQELQTSELTQSDSNLSDSTNGTGQNLLTNLIENSISNNFSQRTESIKTNNDSDYSDDTSNGQDSNTDNTQSTTSNGQDVQPTKGHDSTESTTGGTQPTKGNDSTESTTGATQPTKGNDSTEPTTGGTQPTKGHDSTESTTGGTQPTKGNDITEPTTGATQPTKGNDITEPTTGNTDIKVYYNITFHVANGVDDVEMPEDSVFEADTKISSIKTPYKQNYIFMGWYYDEELTQKAEMGDTINRNMNLWARMVEGSSNEGTAVITYVSDTDQLQGFVMHLKADGLSAEDVKNSVTIKNISDGNSLEELLVTGTSDDYTVQPVKGFVSGKAYQLEINGLNIYIIYNGEVQSSSVRYYNVTMYKEPVFNAKLSNGIKFIPYEDVSNLGELAPLFQADISGVTKSVAHSGTFTYKGQEDINSDDIVCIYKGERPDTLNDANNILGDGEVTYVKITSISNNEYSYDVADTEDVLFTPDVFPISVEQNQDGNATDGTLVVDKSVLDYSDGRFEEMNLNSSTTIDNGDFVAIYSGELDDGEIVQYGRITSYSEVDNAYNIVYENVGIDDITSSMDVYGSQEADITDMANEHKEELEEEVRQQAYNSGFVAEAANYLGKMALETNGFEEISDDFDISTYDLDIGMPDIDVPVRSTIKDEDKVEIKKLEVTPYTSTYLEHFSRKSGVRLSLEIEFEMVIKIKDGDSVKIKAKAVFEQEVMADISVSASTKWGWKWFIPYVKDYNVTAGVSIGTWTNAGATASAYTSHEDEFDWDKYMKEVSDDDDYASDKKFIANIGKTIDELKEEHEEFMGEVVDDNNDTLAERYSNMLKTGESGWIELYKAELFEEKIPVLLGIIQIKFSGDFVVSTNVNITLGMTFEYGNAKKYVFNIGLFSRKCSNYTIDIEPEHYQFEFYVMGTLGLKAGIEIEVAVGLFDADLDSVGITGEVGAYVKLWGYFYYVYNNTAGQQYTGAFYIEVGAYLEIGFKAQMGNGKLQYTTTLYDQNQPIWSAGMKQVVTDFAYSQEDTPTFEFEGQKSQPITNKARYFDMEYLDLEDGSSYAYDQDKNHQPRNMDTKVDGSQEKNFIVDISDKRFAYNAFNNTISYVGNVNNEQQLRIDFTLTLTWRNQSKFSSASLSRTIPVVWHKVNQSVDYTVVINRVGENTPYYTSEPLEFKYTGKPGDALRKVVDENLKVEGYEIIDRDKLIAQIPEVFPTKSAQITGKANPAMVTITVVDYSIGTEDLSQYDTYQYSNKYSKFVVCKKELGQRTITVPTGTKLTNEILGYNDYEGYQYQGYVKPIYKGSTFEFHNARKGDYPACVFNWNGTNLNKKVPLYMTDDSGNIYANSTTDTSSSYSVACYYMEGGSTVHYKTTPIKRDYLSDSYYEQSYNDIVKYVPANADMAKAGPVLDDTEDGTFAGWQREDGSEAGLAKVGEEITLVPIWTPKEIEKTVKFIGDESEYNKGYDTKWDSDYKFKFTAGKEYTIKDIISILQANNVDISGFEISSLKYVNSDLSKVRVYNDSNDLYVIANRKQFTVTLIDKDTNEQLSKQEMKYDDNIVEYANKLKDDYTVVSIVDKNGNEYKTVPASDITLYVTYQGNNAEYKVQYWVSNDDKTEYENFSSEIQSGPRGSVANPAIKDFGGHYIYDAEKSDSNIVIAADGSSIVNIYYTKGYIVTFDLDNGEENITKSYAKGDTIEYPEKVNKMYYNFSKWSLDIDTMPSEDITIKAEWKPCQYKINYYNADKKINTDYHDYGQSTTKLFKPNYKAYNFLGWYDNPELTGEPRAEEIGPEEITSDINLYGKFIAATYNVELTVDEKPYEFDKVYTYGDTLELPKLQKEGYTFKGWYKDSKCEGSTISEINQSQIDNMLAKPDKLSYYGKWEKNKYTVTLKTNGSEQGDSEIERYYDEEVKLPTDLTKTGYLFEGWYKDSDYTQAIDTIQANTKENVICYAKWRARDDISYTVNYYEQDTTTGEYVLTDTKTFKGTTDAKTDVKAEEKDNFTAKEIEQKTIKADGSTVIDVYYYRNDIKYTVNYYEQNIQDDEYTLTDTQEFKGIAGETTQVTVKDKQGFETKAFEQAVIKIDGSTVINVYYDRNVYSIIFVPDNGDKDIEYTLRYGATITIPETPTKKGYTFEGWGIDSTIATESATYTAAWKAQTYTITLELNGGSVEGETTYKHTYKESTTTLPTPTKDGYNFEGWYTNAEFDGDAVITVDSESITSDTVYYAKWKEKQSSYKINVYIQNIDNDDYELVNIFTREGVVNSTTNVSKDIDPRTGFTAKEIEQQIIKEDGSTVVNVYYDRNTYTVTFKNGDDIVKSESLRYGAGITVPTTEPQKKGYNLDNWATSDGTNLVDGATVESDITYEAQWKAIVYNITYEGLEGADNSANPTTYTVESSITLTSPANRTGYTFTGWTVNGVEIDETIWKSAEDITITANWEANVYNITYEGIRDADNSFNPTTYTYGVKPTINYLSDLEGCYFKNWTINGVDIENVDSSVWQSEKDIIITANWRYETYNITYEGLEGADNSENPTTYTIEKPITLKEPASRAGYRFVNWTVDGVEVNDSTWNTTGGLIITANWAPDSTRICNLHVGDTVYKKVLKTGNLYVDVWNELPAYGYDTTYKLINYWSIKDEDGNMVKFDFSDNPTPLTDIDIYAVLADEEHPMDFNESIAQSMQAILSGFDDIDSANSRGVNNVSNGGSIGDITIDERELMAWNNSYYQMSDDVTLEGWTESIGTKAHPFNGVLDGNGHKITYSAFYISDTEQQDSTAPLFGYITNTIKNLSADGEINCSEVTDFVGGIVSVNQGTISNCSFDGTLKASGSNIAVGAITGCNMGTIENCSLGSQANITVDGNNSFIGGIVGKNSDNATIHSCTVNDNAKITFSQTSTNTIRRKYIGVYEGSTSNIDTDILNNNTITD